MAQPRRTEDCLDELSRLRENPTTPEARADLGRYLGNKSNVVAAKAAKIVAEFEIQDLEPQLMAAFHRFMKSPASTDKGCAAKTEIVRALEALGVAEGEVFLAGIRHVQMEGSFGPPVDTAAGLRAASAMGLVHMNHPDAILETVSLLVDREDDARIGAVRALAAAGHPATVPLLRFKVLAGDASADVIAESFLALLEVAPETSLGFVAGYLDSSDTTVAETAAIALGESRQPEAIVVLKSKWPGAGETLRPALLMGMAVARDDSAFEFLFSLIEGAVEKIAAEAITALAMYRQDDRIRGRVEALVRQRKGTLLARTLAAEFGAPRT
ncbi:MAG TPA: HEAT repeat domain-containing protein [Bryobacteraceae bacterium]|nr:HEAT repeat domain-containing protein [Bryobacteraceae bacterium]